jgi:hypothetical protein
LVLVERATLVAPVEQDFPSLEEGEVAVHPGVWVVGYHQQELVVHHSLVAIDRLVPTVKQDCLSLVVAVVEATSHPEAWVVVECHQQEVADLHS